MEENKLNIILCNGASLPKNLKRFKVFDPPLSCDAPNNNIEIGLPKFVNDIYHLQDNIKDLLEIAGFVFSADRIISRGANFNVEYHSWARRFHFVIKVRDYDFWTKEEVKILLKESLEFMSGDKSFDFTFLPGRPKDEFNLFDNSDFKPSFNKPPRIILFSGGLDSTTGVLDNLVSSTDDICLISHKSMQPSLIQTRRDIYNKINKDYEGRTKYYEFKCHLRGLKRVEETQRTRTFLYSSIGFALANAFKQNKIAFYENGITSINFPDSQDMINARASRTTHPKTIGLVEKFFKQFNNEFVIEHPYFFFTKADVIEKLKNFPDGKVYISSTVSCSSSTSRTGNITHCGGCSQCIERKIAMYAVDCHHYDDQVGLYEMDFIKGEIAKDGVKKVYRDYIKIALKFINLGIDKFYEKYMEIISDLIDYIKIESEEEFVTKLYNLYLRHGNQVEKAIETMRNLYQRPFAPEKIFEGSLLDWISRGEQFKTNIETFIEEISIKLSKSLPIIFQKNKPLDENDLNDKIEGLLKNEVEKFYREFPLIKYSLTTAKPDHCLIDNSLFIETKYPRKSMTMSKLTDQILADISKYEKESSKLFAIYDPERKIKDDEEFKKDIEKNRKCFVTIIR